MHKTKTTEWHNELKPTENELKMRICLLTLYLNHFNKNKLMLGRTFKESFFFLRQNKVNLGTLTHIFLAPVNMKSAAFDTVL